MDKVMKKLDEDVRGKICEIISKMLDNPDECGIYPTTKCYDELEEWIKSRDRKLLEVLIKDFDGEIDACADDATKESNAYHQGIQYCIDKLNALINEGAKEDNGNNDKD